jgi:hypothetical protein
MTARRTVNVLVMLLAAGAALALPTPPVSKEDRTFARRGFVAQSTSSVVYTSKDGVDTVETTNAGYEISGEGLPGRPPKQRLVLRKLRRLKQILGEKGVDAKVSVQAWPLGSSFRQKPVYSISLSGLDATAMDNAFLVVTRGTEEVDWWSVLRLGSGQHLFDTNVPLVRFSISDETQTLRYAGFEIPPGDTPDARLKQPDVIGVLIYASAEGVIREALLTCSDTRRARLLRSYWDGAREMSYVERRAGRRPGAAAFRGLRIAMRQTDLAEPSEDVVLIPIVNDDLDLSHVRVIGGVNAAAWKR